MTIMNLANIDYITFDCYGTLIDWESGILSAVRPVLSARGVAGVDNEEIIRVYAALERQVEATSNAGEFVKYREVLHQVMRGIGDHFGLAFSQPELDRLPESIARWKPFADVPAALASLARRCGLVITSNIDNDLFEHSRKQLVAGGDWDFTRVVTAELSRSYKPHHRHWKVALALLDTTPDRVLHVAESVYHDVVPAKALGMQTVWINRRGERGPGASGGVDVALRFQSGSQRHEDVAPPDLELRTLGELAAMMESQ